MKKWKIIISVIILALVVSACGNSSKETKKEPSDSKNLMDQPYSKTDFLMGTVVTLKIYDKGKEDVLDKGFDRIKDLAAKITTSDSEKTSEVDKINEQAGKKPVKVSKDVYYLIQEGLKYSENSGGSFDITIGPLTSLWHIGFSDARKPSLA
ncbi:FAD:protein FMN transferase, partial [Listeria seeligeri]|uniref:FAD:protein FMN transferase n=1 Tax=Listeria seeligeri TaxID=1640 RepID=UPI0016270AF1